LKTDVYRPGRLAVDGQARRERGGVVRSVSKIGRVVIVGAVAIIAVAAVGFVFVGALNSDYVSVNSFEVKGNEFLTDEEVVELSGIEDGVGLFSLDLGGAERALMADPRIVDASVGRRFPGRVVITLEERRAVGSVVISEKVYKIAEDGLVVGELAADYEDLPLICGLAMKPGEGDVIGMRFKGLELEDASRVLVALRAEPGLYAKVDYIRADEGWFELSGGEVKVLYGHHFGPRESKRIWRVWCLLRPEERIGSTMDVRFDGDVIVRNEADGEVITGDGDNGGGEN
jgi:hypothetical protein